MLIKTVYVKSIRKDKENRRCYQHSIQDLLLTDVFDDEIMDDTRDVFRLNILKLHKVDDPDYVMEDTSPNLDLKCMWSTVCALKAVSLVSNLQYRRVYPSKIPIRPVCHLNKDYPIEDLYNMINVLSERDDEGVSMFVVEIYSLHPPNPRKGKPRDYSKSPTHCFSIDLRNNDFVIWS